MDDSDDAFQTLGISEEDEHVKEDEFIPEDAKSDEKCAETDEGSNE